MRHFVTGLRPRTGSRNGACGRLYRRAFPLAAGGWGRRLRRSFVVTNCLPIRRFATAADSGSNRGPFRQFVTTIRLVSYALRRARNRTPARPFSPSAGLASRNQLNADCYASLALVVVRLERFAVAEGRQARSAGNERRCEEIVWSFGLSSALRQPFPLAHSLLLFSST